MLLHCCRQNVTSTFRSINSSLRGSFQNRTFGHQKRSRVPPPFKHNGTAKSVTPFGWMLLSVPAVTFGLGCWQVHRKQWKEDLIRNLESKMRLESVPLPDDLSELEDMEYEKVTVRGTFLHDQEMYLGPRALIHDGDSRTTGGLFSQQETSIGYLIITPFQLEGREDKILINRGWVPKRFLDASTRPLGQTKGIVELQGVVRRPENRPQFTPQQRGEIFLFRDVPKMAQIAKTEPYLLDASFAATITGGPIGGQTRVTLRNEHLSYIITWFSLSGFTSWLWVRLILRGKSF
ncbi:SURF1-like protein [Uranotaenia lowii]|uniref:SURF1-like protein n=1 Tax=Uranotaenia lowii TaxID=190385 RepID=UPI002478EEB9|nr:SURF1-like protein [Uranotaenia lowii]